MARTSKMFEKFLCLFIFVIVTLLLSSSQATAKKFHVGGKEGWIVKPSEDYNHWAQRNRFHVNDTLHFKYMKGTNSVLVVKKKDYDSCNTNNPLNKMDDGDSTFKLDKPGLFFFIGGKVEDCKDGQKLIVLVMGVKHPIPLAPASPPQPTHQTAEEASPSPSPSKASVPARLGVGVGVGVVFIIMISFAGLV